MCRQQKITRSGERLLALPLRGLGEELSRLVRSGDLGGELGEHGLVSGHASGELGEVGHLVGQTDGAAVDEHEVAGLAVDLIDLEDTSAEHGLLKLVQEVLAETHGPAGTHLGGSHGVLVDEAVDGSDSVGHLDGLAGEDLRELSTTHAQTLSWLGLDRAHGANSDEEVTDGGHGTAVALGHNILDLVGGRAGVGLQGQVVVSDLLALALEDLEHVVGGLLDGLVELDLEVTLGVLEVLGNALLDSLGLSLTNGDGTVQGLVEVSLHHLGLLLDELAVIGGGLGSVVGNTGEAGHGLLGLGSVGSDNVGQHDDLGVEASLGTSELVLGGELGSGGGGVELTHGLKVGLLHSGHLLVEGGGGSGQVLLHLDLVGLVQGTELLDLTVEVLGESLDLLSGGLLVLVHEHTQLTAGLGGLGETVVGELLDTHEVLLHLKVDTDLVGLHGDNLTGDLGDVVDKDLLGVLGLSDGEGHLGTELLAEVSDLLGSLLAGSRDIGDGLLEAGVGKGSLLGEGIVQAVHGGAEGTLSVGTVLGELVVSLTELLIHLLLSELELLLHEVKGGLLAGGVLGRELLDGILGVLLLGSDGSQGLGLGGLEGGTSGLGDLLHLLGLGGDVSVGLLDLLGSLLGEGGLGASVGGHGILDHAGNLIGVSLDLLVEGLALESGLGVDLGGLGVESNELLHTILDSDVKVLAGNLGGGADSVEHLLLHLVAGLLGLEGEGLNTGISLVTELGDLRVETVVQEPLGVLVHLGATLLDELGTLPTGGDSLGGHDTGQGLDLAVGLLVVGSDNLAELVDLLAELGLGETHGIEGIEAHAAGVSSELSVGLGLGSLVVVQLLEDGGSALLQLSLGVHTVSGKLLAHRGEGSVELEGHLVELAVSLSLILSDQVLELGITLKVGLVALVAKLDHASHLSVHIGVDLSLGSGVGAHDASLLVNTVVHLGHLLLHSGGEGQELHLELSGGSVNLGSGLLLGSGDGSDSLSIALVLEGLLGVEGSLETHGSLTKGHVDVMTVVGHLGLDIVELGRSGSDEALDLVVGPGAGGLGLGSELGREAGTSVLGL